MIHSYPDDAELYAESQKGRMMTDRETIARIRERLGALERALEPILHERNQQRQQQDIAYDNFFNSWESQNR
jgi:hypothetical protein